MVDHLSKIQLCERDGEAQESSDISDKEAAMLGSVGLYWKENLVWSAGYFVSSVGVDKETIKRYVEQQGQQVI
jgi:REP element-mobilizing transposase RayT